MRLNESLIPVSPGRYQWLVPLGWGQARGVFGGLILANLVSCLKLEPERPLRTLTAHFCGPVQPGVASIEVLPLRVGKGQSTFSVQLNQEQEIQAQVIAVAGRNRAEDTDFTTLKPPPGPAWGELDDLSLPSSVVPEFTQHYRYRSASGTPFSGKPPETVGWVERRMPLALDVPELMGYLDAWWPTILVREKRPRPAATVSFSLQMVGSLANVKPPLCHVGRLMESRAGYATEYRELWTSQGQLLALCQQTFAVIQ